MRALAHSKHAPGQGNSVDAEDMAGRNVMKDSVQAADPAVIARLSAAPVRLAIVVGLSGVLGAQLVWTAWQRPPAAAIWQGAMILAGVAALWLALRLWRTRGITLELTATELREAGGRRIALLSEMEHVIGGSFALKPAKGFAVRLAAPGPTAWCPGFWWRQGRRIGVGGMTSSLEAHLMAEALTGLLVAQSKAKPKRPAR